MTPADSRDLAAFVNERARRTNERVELWLGLVLVLLVGVAGGVLAVLFATPCEAGHLCSVGAMLATAADRKGPWAQRGRLTGADLDRRQAERETAAMSLPERLLATGVMTGPFTSSEPVSAFIETPPPILSRETPRRVAEFVRVYRQYRAHHPRRYAAQIAWGIAFLDLPF